MSRSNIDALISKTDLLGIEVGDIVERVGCLCLFEVEQELSKLKVTIVQLESKLLDLFQSEINKIPKSVLEMKLSEFVAQYEGSLDVFLAKQASKSVAVVPTSSKR